MKLSLLSPPDDRPNEMEIVQALFQSGLARYHLRKPNWDGQQVFAWLMALPDHLREKVWLHSHHELANDFQIGGIHFRDTGIIPQPTLEASNPGHAMGRSCHDIPSLRLAIGHYDSVFFSPIFPSLSKPGYGPLPALVVAQLQQVLSDRKATARRTVVYALGGITPAHVEPCRKLGFDGVAVLGAIWNAPDPLRSFREFFNVVEIPPATPSLSQEPAQ
jgi:thiamine-phosphate pyrophosphorylase